VLQVLGAWLAPEAEAPEAAAREWRSSLLSLFEVKVLLLDMVLKVYNGVSTLIHHHVSGA
jgi:hypothetical protein